MAGSFQLRDSVVPGIYILHSEGVSRILTALDKATAAPWGIKVFLHPNWLHIPL